jgi:hypothetical protein
LDFIILSCEILPAGNQDKYVLRINYTFWESRGLAVTFDNMASKGLRAISYQGTRKVEAGYKPSKTSETLIGYIVCCAVVHFYFVI